MVRTTLIAGILAAASLLVSGQEQVAFKSDKGASTTGDVAQFIRRR